MANRNICLILSVMILGLLFVNNIDAQTDNLLNGRWITSLEGIDIEYKIDDGNFEISINGEVSSRGTYTLNKGEITFTETHIYGGSVILDGLFSILGIPGLEPKWYSRNDFIILIRPIFLDLGLTERQINDAIVTMMSSTVYNYSVETSSLILVSVSDNDVIIFNRK